MEDKEVMRGDIIFIIVKVFVMVMEIVMESFGFVKNAVHGIPEMEKALDEGSTTNITINADLPQYIRSAYAYSLFYILGIIYTISYWVIYARSKRREDLPFMGTLILFFCNMPVMVCDMYMIKSRGEMSWNMHGIDLGLHMVFCFNAVVHIYMNVYTASEPKGAFSYVIILALSWLLTCCLYAPVTWSMVGWQWLGAVDLDEVVGLKVHDRSYKVLSAFILLGNIGQFIIAAIIVMAIYSHFASHPPKDPPKGNRDNIDNRDPLIVPTANQVQGNQMPPNQVPTSNQLSPDRISANQRNQILAHQKQVNQVQNNKLPFDPILVENKKPINNVALNETPDKIISTNQKPNSQIPVIHITDNQVSESKNIPEIIIA